MPARARRVAEAAQDCNGGDTGLRGACPSNCRRNTASVARPGSLAADCSPVLNPGAIRRFKYGFPLGQIAEDGAARSHLHRKLFLADSPRLYSSIRDGAPSICTLPCCRGTAGRHRCSESTNEDERQSGVTVHRVSRKVDSGAILGQEIIELPPGATIQHLYDETTARGASLLARVVDEIEQGVPTAAPQHEAQATKEPRGQRQKTPTGNRD